MWPAFYKLTCVLRVETLEKVPDPVRVTELMLTLPLLLPPLLWLELLELELELLEEEDEDDEEPSSSLSDPPPWR